MQGNKETVKHSVQLKSALEIVEALEATVEDSDVQESLALAKRDLASACRSVGSNQGEKYFHKAAGNIASIAMTVNEDELAHEALALIAENSS